MTTWTTLFEHLLCHGGLSLIVDGTAEGVELPAHVRANPLVLMYELEPVVPIPDLVVDDTGIRATLSFSREPCATFIPWAAVRGMQALQVTKPERTKLRSV